jgi:hypothetical protein
MKTRTAVSPAAPLRALLAMLLLAAPLAAQNLLDVITGSAGDGLAVVADIGDINGDGKLDIACGSPEYLLGRGRVSVKSGADGSVLFTATGVLAGERFGAAIARVGDINSDGKPDLVVGAPGTLVMSGYARVISGANGSTLLTLLGPSLGSRFGAAVAGAGDCNADGKPDVLVGAPMHSELLGFGNGFVATYSGTNGSLLQSATGCNGQHLGSALDGCSITDQEPNEIIGCSMEGSATGCVQIRKRSSFELLATVNGPSAGSGFGSAVARLGDVNGDGKGDLAVGAPGAGKVIVLSGADWSPLCTLTAPAAGTGFGSSVARMGDTNGDGDLELAVGAPLADVNGTDSGSLTLYSGLKGALIYSIVGGAAGDRLGSSAASVGDLDGDGHPEFAVCSPGADTPGTADEKGQASVIALKLWNSVENGLPGLEGIPRLVGNGGLAEASEAKVELTSARPITGATLVLGLSLIVDAAHGVLVPTPDIVVTGLQTTGAGTLNYGFALQGLLKGSVVYQQFLLVDSSAPGGIARSNTVAATVP